MDTNGNGKHPISIPVYVSFDVLAIRVNGDAGIFINGQQVAVCPGDGRGPRLDDPAVFFDQLGQATGVIYQVYELDLTEENLAWIGLCPYCWNWPDIEAAVAEGIIAVEAGVPVIRRLAVHGCACSTEALAMAQSVWP